MWLNRESALLYCLIEIEAARNDTREQFDNIWDHDCTMELHQVSDELYKLHPKADEDQMHVNQKLAFYYLYLLYKFIHKTSY